MCERDRCIWVYVDIIRFYDDDDEIKQKFENTFNRSIINDLKCWNQLLLFTVAPKRYDVCYHRDTSVTPWMLQIGDFTRLPTHSIYIFVIRYVCAHTNGKSAVSICCSRYTLHFIHFTTWQSYKLLSMRNFWFKFD